MTPSLIDSLQLRRDALKAGLHVVIEKADAEHRDMTRAESDLFDADVKTIRELDARITQLTNDQRRDANAAHARTASMTGTQNFTSTYANSLGPVASIGYEPVTYRKGDQSVSFFRDLYEARTSGSREALDRLVRNDQENRALGNTGQTSTLTGGGAGAEFAPPAWLVNEYVALARAGRPTANLCASLPLPSGASSVNLPKVATGTTTAVQSTQNTNLSQTDLTSSSVSSSITTIGGKQVVSQQLLDQAGVHFDQVILNDLAADYAKQLDQQVLSGSGSSGQLAGVLNVSGINTVTYTDASPAVAGAGKLYAVMAKAKQSVDTTRFAPITAWVMHPNRWGWMVASFDSQNRPLFLSDTYNPMNAAGVVERVASQAVVGSIHGLPVVIDAQIPTNLGAGTNQDVILAAKWDDIFLWEGEPKIEAFTATYADSMGVLLRFFNYASFIPNRQPKSIVTIGGTGLVSPSY